MAYTIDKFTIAIRTLRPNTEYSFSSDAGFGARDENEFNTIEWKTGEDEGGSAIITTTCPHPEITWTLVKAEMDKLQVEYDAQDYARKRKAEYPTIEDCVHAILDDDLENLQILRQAVKEKYPK
jgi:hypothetical protein